MNKEDNKDSVGHCEAVDVCSSEDFKEARRKRMQQKLVSKIKWEAKHNKVLTKPPKLDRKCKLKDLDDLYRDFPKMMEPKSGKDSSGVLGFMKRFLLRDPDREATEKIVALFESISFLVYNVYQAVNKRHRLCIIMMWVQARFMHDKSLLLNLTDILCWFAGFKFSDLSEVADEIRTYWAGGVAPESDEPVQKLFEPRGETNDVDLTKGAFTSAYAESETVRRVKQLFQYFVNAGMCNVFGYQFDGSAFQGAIDTVNSAINGAEMIEFLSSSVMFFLERGYAAYDKGNIKYLFFAGEWIDFELEFSDVQSELNVLFAGQSNLGSAAVQALDARITKLIVCCRKQIPLLTAQRKVLMSSRLTKLQLMLTDLGGFKKKIKMREAPFCALFHGDSGVGKSYSMNAALTAVLSELKLPTDPYYTRTPNLQEEFDSMVDNDTVAIILDDLSNTQPKMEKNPPSTCIIKYMNNVVAALNKPDLREKGKVFASPSVVVCSSNVKDLNAGMYSVEPLSVMRRMDVIVHVQCDPKYMTNGKLDVSKWPERNKEIQQPPTTYTVENVSAAPVTVNDLSMAPRVTTYTHKPQEMRFDVVTWNDGGEDIRMEKVSWNTFERYIREMAVRKLKDQQTFINSMRKMAWPITCKHKLTFPFCAVCYKKISKLRSFVMLCYRRRSSVYTRKVTWVGGIDTPWTITVKGEVLRHRKIEKVEWIRRTNPRALMRGALRVLGYDRYAVRYSVSAKGYVWLIPRPKKLSVLYLPASDLHIAEEYVDPALVPVEPPMTLMDFPDVDSEDSGYWSDEGSMHNLSHTSLSDLFTFHDMSSALDSDEDSGCIIEGSSSCADDSPSDDSSEDSYGHYDYFNDSDVEYEPRAGAEESKTNTTESQEVLNEAIRDILRYWNHLEECQYVTQFDTNIIENGWNARMKLRNTKFMEFAPNDFTVVPVPIPRLAPDSFTRVRLDSRDLDELIRTKATLSFRVGTAQRRKSVFEARVEKEEIEEELPPKQRWLRKFNFSANRACMLPVRLGRYFGSFFIDSDGARKTTAPVYLSATFWGLNCFSGIYAAFAYLGIGLGMCCSVVLLPFTIFCSVAMYIGIAHAKYVYAIQHLNQSVYYVSKASRVVLKYKYHVIYSSISLLACGAAYYRYCKKKEVLETRSSTIQAPVPKINERSNNYWVATKVDIKDSTGIDGYQNTPEEMINTIKTQVLRIRVYDKGIKKSSDGGGTTCVGCCALTMSGGLVLVPNHIVRDKVGCLILAMRDGPGLVRNNAEWILSDSDMYQIPGTDFCFLYTPSLGAAKDIKRFLPKKVVTETMRVRWFLKESALLGSFSTKFGSALAAYDDKTDVRTVGKYPGYNFKLYDSDGKSLESMQGWCMSPLVSSTNPSYIHSFYLAGVDHDHRSGVLLQSDVEAALEIFKSRRKVFIPSSGTFEPGRGGVLDVAGKRSPINFLDQCDEANICFDWLGASDEYSRRRFTGRVANTPMAPYLEPLFGCEHRWASPKNLNTWVPFYDNLIHMGVKLHPFDPETMDIAEEDLLDSFLGKCRNWRGAEGETFSDVVFPVTEEVAINGVPGVSGCDRIKMNTSAGFPMNCNKKKVFDEVEDSSYPCGTKLEASEKVKEHMKYIFECAESGERSYVTFRASPKDEPTLPTKEKVRIFAGCPVAYLVAMRMMTSMLVKFMTDNHLLFCTVAGANAHDYDWTLVGAYLAAYSTTRIIGGDYANYDKKVLAYFMVRAVYITGEMLRLAGYTDEQVRIATNLMLESCYPVYEWNGDFIHIYGSNPSGQPLTVWLNNIVNLLYQRYCFYKKYSPKHKYDDCVRILVMGDDNIMAVKEGYDEYNHTSIQEILAQHGMEYTMADKSPISKPYISLSEATLLKRSFVYDDELEVYLCPLDEKSIFRCLYSHMLGCGPKSEAMKDHCVSMVDTALAEWFYYGREVYEDRFAKCVDMLNQVCYSFHVPHLVTYEQQLIRFKVRVLESRCLFRVQPPMKWAREFVPPSDQFVQEFLPSGGLLRVIKALRRIKPEVDVHTYPWPREWHSKYALGEVERDSRDILSPSAQYAYEVERIRCRPSLGFCRKLKEDEGYECFDCYAESLTPWCKYCKTGDFMTICRLPPVVKERLLAGKHPWSDKEFSPCGGMAGYQLKEKFGFRQVFVGSKSELHAEWWDVISPLSRTLILVDGYREEDALFFPSEVWIRHFGVPHLGVHQRSFFDASDPRVLEICGDMVLVNHDIKLDEGYLDSLAPSCITVDGDPLGKPSAEGVGFDWFSGFNAGKAWANRIEGQK